MARSFYFGTDAEVYTGSTAFHTKIAATPTAFGLVAGDATAYGVKQAAYATGYLAAIDPETRTKAKVATKNAAKQALKDATAALAKKIDGTTTVTDEQKIELGLNVRKTPSPVPVPEDQPKIDILSVVGYAVKIHVHGDGEFSRGFPPSVKGAQVYSYIGATPPADPRAWTYEGASTKSVIDVIFDDSTAPGAQVWLRACFFNPRNLCGPANEPVSTRLQYAPASMAA